MNSVEHDEMIRRQGEAKGMVKMKNLIFKVAKLSKENKSIKDIAKECKISTEEVEEILNNI